MKEEKGRLLHKFTRREKRWEWEIKQENLFKTLKKRFITKLILVVSKDEDGGRYIMLCDRRSFVNGICRWKIKTSGLPFQIIE